MSQAAARPASTLYLVGIYTVLLVGFSVLAILVTVFLNFENSAMGVIVSMAAASGMAQAWVVREQAAPPSGRAWKMAALCALITTVLLSGAAAIGLESEGESLRDIASEGLLFMLALVVGILAMNVLVIRLGIWLGGRSNAKRA